jgi:hypothetical protein
VHQQEDHLVDGEAGEAQPQEQAGDAGEPDAGDEADAGDQGGERDEHERLGDRSVQSRVAHHHRGEAGHEDAQHHADAEAAALVVHLGHRGSTPRRGR